MEGYQRAWFDAQEARVHYLHRPGSGTPLVFLSGGVIDSVMLTWKHVLASIPPGYDVYALDLPGYGESGPLRARASLNVYSGVVQRFLVFKQISNAVLFGTSMGGAIALDLAPISGPDLAEMMGSRRREPLLRALVLSGSYGLQSRAPLHVLAYILSRIPNLERVVLPLIRTRKAMRLALGLVFRDPSRITGELVDDALREANRPTALREFVRWLRHEVSPTHVQSNFRPDLPRIDLPVLIVHGRYDWLMPVDRIWEAAGLLPNAEVHVFDAGHIVPRELPEEVVAVIHDFLRRIR